VQCSRLPGLRGSKAGAMIGRATHVAAQASQGAAARLDAIGYAAATPQGPTA